MNSLPVANRQLGQQLYCWPLMADATGVIFDVKRYAIHYCPDMPFPARNHTNPKRKRGRQVLSSLALQVSVGCVKLDRERYAS